MNQKPGPALPLGKLGTKYSMGDVEKPVYSQLDTRALASAPISPI